MAQKQARSPGGKAGWPHSGTALRVTLSRRGGALTGARAVMHARMRGEDGGGMGMGGTVALPRCSAASRRSP
eukprot:COSAG01_NODE_150_length_23941_cov_44.277200_7_plen_72_part_00